jgi:hypothetical protein
LDGRPHRYQKDTAPPTSTLRNLWQGCHAAERFDERFQAFAAQPARDPRFRGAARLTMRRFEGVEVLVFVKIRPDD